MNADLDILDDFLKELGAAYLDVLPFCFTPGRYRPLFPVGEQLPAGCLHGFLPLLIAFAELQRVDARLRSSMFTLAILHLVIQGYREIVQSMPMSM